jgi:cytidylate kinase
MAVITISRQRGSGGDEIAVRVCEMLGYRVFDKRLMARVASDVGLSEGEMVDFTEESYKVRSFLERLFPGRGARTVAQVRTWREDVSGARVPEVRELDEEEAITMARGAIRAAYDHGNVVIVGRGGQVVLQDKRDVLHVRIAAPLQARVDRLLAEEDLTIAPAQQRSVARELAAASDAAAAEYLQRFYEIDWADPAHYHLVINTGKMSVEAAAHLVVNAVSHLPPLESSD